MKRQESKKPTNELSISQNTMKPKSCTRTANSQVYAVTYEEVCKPYNETNALNRLPSNLKNIHNSPK